MRRNIARLQEWQVFLNYPFDEEYSPYSMALHFAVIASNLVPLCTHDIVPDLPRLNNLVDAVSHSQYSLHDLSRSKGYGDENFARGNMPLETGMAVFHAIHTEFRRHRCALFVPTQYDYQSFASDLAGLDVWCYEEDDDELLSLTYEWLRKVVPELHFNSQSTSDVVDKYGEFKGRLTNLRGKPRHDEVQELMYQICGKCDWWDWRVMNKFRDEFPELPLAWKD